MDDATKSATEHQMHRGCGGPPNARRDTAMQQQARDDSRPAGSALDILDVRFARGEMDRVEYLEKKQLISQRASVPNAGQFEPDAPKSPSMPPTTSDVQPR